MDDAETKLSWLARLATDLDRERGVVGNFAVVVASDIRAVLDGHPERVAWTSEPGGSDSKDAR